MKIQMIPAEIRKDGNFKSKFLNALHCDCVRRHFHHCVFPSCIDHLPEQLFEIGRFRRRSFRRKLETRSAIFDCSKRGRGPIRRFQDFLHQVCCRRLSIRSGNPHQVELSGRMPEEVAGHAGQSGTLVFDLNPGHP